PLGRAVVQQSVLSIRTTMADPRGVAAAAIGRIHEIDPDVPSSRVATMEEMLAEVAAPVKLTTILIALFALVAVTLALTGLYGVIAYLVLERTREIGIRAALGASAADIVRLVMGGGLRLIAPGIVLGIGGYLMLTRLMTHALVGVSAIDPWIVVATVLMVVVTGAAACLLPALKAIKIDPAAALRFE
ncbi:MAG TPA: FtsX-like permease family protein, partial [Blastocatellia bacterium]